MIGIRCFSPKLFRFNCTCKEVATLEKTFASFQWIPAPSRQNRICDNAFSSHAGHKHAALTHRLLHWAFTSMTITVTRQTTSKTTKLVSNESYRRIVCGFRFIWEYIIMFTKRIVFCPIVGDFEWKPLLFFRHPFVMQLVQRSLFVSSFNHCMCTCQPVNILMLHSGIHADTVHLIMSLQPSVKSPS